MTAIDIIQQIRQTNHVNLSELAEYADLGTVSNISQILSRNDLKVETFVAMLEVMGYQLVVQSAESDDEIIVDYDL